MVVDLKDLNLLGDVLFTLAIIFLNKDDDGLNQQASQIMLTLC